MARPPGQIFQKGRVMISETKEVIKKNTIKYFLIFYLFTELLSFIAYELNPVFYYEFLFNFIVQMQFFVMFIFLLRFNFCIRNKIIIYTLLFYFLANAFSPLFITNKNYTDIIRDLSIFLLSILIIYTLSKNEK
jgi:hypothetical protein